MEATIGVATLGLCDLPRLERLLWCAELPRSISPSRLTFLLRMPHITSKMRENQRMHSGPRYCAN